MRPRSSKASIKFHECRDSVSAASDPTVTSRAGADSLLRTEPQVRLTSANTFIPNNHCNYFMSHYDTNPASGRWRSCLEPSASAARQKVGGSAKRCRMKCRTADGREVEGRRSADGQTGWDCRRVERSRVGIFAVHSRVERRQTWRGQVVPITRRCPWLRAAWACGPALLATDSQDRPLVARSIGHRMSGETSEYTSEQAMRDRA